MIKNDDDEPITLYKVMKVSSYIISLGLLFIFILILLLTGTSCNPSKIAARKDVAAVDRVKGSRNLINQVAPIVNDLFCNRFKVSVKNNKYNNSAIRYKTGY